MKKLLPLLLLSSVCSFIFAQSPTAFNLNILPPSPNAAALGKFGDIPVSYYTGLPNIGIPIYTVESGDLQVPISLGYHASGIKVEEIASWCGLGWSLNAGGAITRTRRELPDELEGVGFWYTAPIPVLKPGDYVPQEYEFYMDGVKDSQCDLFHFNFAGHSGKFIIDKGGNVHITPQQKIRIEKTHGLVSDVGSLFNTIIKWTVTTEDGVQYIFDQLEKTEPETFIPGQGGIPSLREENNVSSWFLSRIIGANKKDTISFGYEDYYLNYRYQVSQTFPGSDVFTTVSLRGKRLNRIAGKESIVKFTPGGYRRDYSGDKVLKSIAVLNYDSVLINKFEFSYSYFDGGGVEPFDENYTPQYNGGMNIHQTSKRLKLDAIQEITNTGTKPPYQLEYNTSPSLPDRFSFSVDHWGFYNGANNTTLVPQLKEVRTTDGATSYLVHAGGNREPHKDYGKAGMLTKIHYPTGGSTRFKYESHNTDDDKIKGPIDDKILSLAQVLIPPVSAYTELNTLLTVSSPDFAEVDILATQVHFDNPECRVHVQIKRVATGATWFTKEYTQNSGLVRDKIKLPPGGYTARHWVTRTPGMGNECAGEGYVISVSYPDETPDTDRLVGGMRISKIISQASGNAADTLVKHFEYNTGAYDSAGNPINSGRLVTLPSYAYYLMNVSGHSVVPELRRTSTTNLPLATTQGSHIGYKRVKVYSFNKLGQREGETVYEYTSAEDHPDSVNISYKYDVLYQITLISGNTYRIFQKTYNLTLSSTVNQDYPYPPVDSYDWKRGLLRRQTDYKIENNIPVAVRETVNDYDFIYGPNTLGTRVASERTDGTRSGLTFKYFNTSTGRVELSKSTTTIFGHNNAQPYRTETTYQYSPVHFQPVTITQTIHTGQKNITRRKYPLDYINAGDPQLADHAALVNANVISPVIEEQQWVDKQGVQKMYGGVIKKYNATLLKPESVYVFETPVNVAQLNNEPKNGNAYSTLLSDSRYRLRMQYRYDSDGNAAEQETDAGVKVAYRWAYQSTLPVAKADNAAYADIFHTSFEEDGTLFTDVNGNTLAKSGIKVRPSGSYTFPASFTPASSNLVMSYWYHDGSVWKFSGYLPYTSTISTSATKLDEVRVHPAAATMTSYAYLPGIGLSSITDANGTTTYYTYDALNRLKAIRDNARNMVQYLQYNYATTPGGTGF